MAEKTEKATPKKLRDARKKGQVAKSQDFPSAFTFLVSILGTVFFGNYLFKTLATYILGTFGAISQDIDLKNRAGAYLYEAIMVIAIASFPIVLVVAFVGVIVNFLIIGPVFSMQALKFDFKRLNPVEGIKQKFKLKVLVELLKSVFKIAGAAGIIYHIIWTMLPEIIHSAALPVAGIAMILTEFLKRATIQVGLFFILVALFDLAFQKRTFAKEMMMEKFEVRQEYKDTEGDPHVKGRRREMFREIAYTEGPTATRRAKMVVTNPTHLAVALSYDTETKEVPKILTMGQGLIAEKIMEIALESKIPIMRNVELAHTLYYKGRVNQYIPEETYQAVAEILKWLEQLEKAEVPEFLK